MYNLVRLFLFHKYMKRLRTNEIPQTNRKFNIVFLVYRCLEYEREKKKYQNGGKVSNSTEWNFETNCDNTCTLMEKNSTHFGELILILIRNFKVGLF